MAAACPCTAETAILKTIPTKKSNPAVRLAWCGRVCDRDLAAYANLAAEANPTHVDAVMTSSDLFHKDTAPRLWGGAIIASVLGTQLPGPGTVLVDQSLHFLRPIIPGDTITVTVAWPARSMHRGSSNSSAARSTSAAKTSSRATALVVAPTEKISRPFIVVPLIEPRPRVHRYERLFAMARGLEPIRTAVVWPVDELSLLGAVEAARAGLIAPVLAWAGGD
jgi:acyl dehydratase